MACKTDEVKGIWMEFGPKDFKRIEQAEKAEETRKEKASRNF